MGQTVKINKKQSPQCFTQEKRPGQHRTCLRASLTKMTNLINWTSYLFSGKLTLKIPWKNLYNDAVVATLDGLYLLVVPGASK